MSAPVVPGANWKAAAEGRLNLRESLRNRTKIDRDRRANAVAGGASVDDCQGSEAGAKPVVKRSDVDDSPNGYSDRAASGPGVALEVPKMAVPNLDCGPISRILP